MTAYLVACALAAPALLIGLLVAAGWLVHEMRTADQLINQLIDKAAPRPVKPGRTCAELGQCSRDLTGDQEQP